MIKAELIKENERLKRALFDQNSRIKEERENVEIQLRKVGLTMGYNVEDWETLFCLIGKLKAESDLSSAIRGRDKLKKENFDLKGQLRKMYFKESK
jgi:hypothetical protein